MAITLRGYQKRMVHGATRALPRHRRVISQAPTGSGKTYVAAWMIREALSAGKTVWFVVHRIELLDQAAETMRAFGLSFSYIAANLRLPKNRYARLQLCMVQTLYNRLDSGLLQPPDLIVCDECHHAVAKTWLAIAEKYPGAMHLGFTATPEREDGKGLDEIYNVIVQGPPVQWLIDNGHLADYDWIYGGNAPDMQGIAKRAGDFAKGATADLIEKTIIGDAPKEYLKHVAPHTCLVYCTLRSSARKVRDRYIAAGVNAHYVGGDTPTEKRHTVMRMFKKGKIPVVVSVDLFGEGLDAPGLKAIQMLRPTMSLRLFLQQVGRVLRPDSGKAVVLDQVGNVFRHGLPCEERDWRLEGRPKKTMEEDPGIRLSHCEFCFAVFPAAEVCPACGMPVEKKRHPLPEVAGKLEKLDKARFKKERAAKKSQDVRQWARTDRSMKGLVRIAIEHDYKFGWAAMRMSVRTGAPAGAMFAAERKARREMQG